MDNQATARVKDLLSKNDRLGIVVGKNPTLDQMASALSLYGALTQIGKHVTVASPTEPIVANSSLVGIDKVKTALSGDGGDLIVSFPYREGEIEKVSYTLENGYLNIVVKATEDGLSFEQQDVIFKRLGGLPSLLFIVGTARLADLGHLFDAEALKNTAVINIDIQNDNQGFGDVVLVSPQASSVCELIGSLLQSLEIEIDQDGAQNLLSGISAATDNFQAGSTSFLAFEMAAMLMRKGAKRTEKTEMNTADAKSPFGPFTMPQPRNVQSQSVSRDAQHTPRQQPTQQPREARSEAPRQQVQSGAQRADRPWEQRTEQPRRQPQGQQQQQQQHTAPRNDQSTHQPSQMQAVVSTRGEQKPLHEVEHKEVKDDQETPPDWLAPKVYKSSTLL